MENRFEEIEKRLDWWEDDSVWLKGSIAHATVKIVAKDMRELIAKLKKQHQDNLIENGK